MHGGAAYAVPPQLCREVGAMDTIDVRSRGAVGDGLTDDWAAIQGALDEGAGREVYIHAGVYRVPHTLRVGSHTAIRADAGARIFHCGSTQKRRGDFLLTNSDRGDCDISVTGGVWDGNFDGRNNDKPSDLFDPRAWSGALMNFNGVRGLRLSDMQLVNSVTYYVRMGGVDGFDIARLSFGARRLSYNQDGLHFGGGCRNGRVEDITAADGETNDDMIALNADDSVVRLENRDLERAAIENIAFRGIRAANCYTAVRMLSVDHCIRNITIENLECGCRHFALNMDGARYCRTPLFREEDMPLGCGLIENVRIDGMRVFASDAKATDPLICAETRCRGLSITGFERVLERDCCANATPTLLARNLVDATITLGQKGARRSINLAQKSDILNASEPFEELCIDSRE